MYQPAEDSWLLSETTEKFLKNELKNKQINKQIKILDIGSGTGIQAETIMKLGFKNILTSDIDEKAVKLLKKKFKSVKSDLFSDIKEKFDLIVFNPPYLPEDKKEPEDSKTATTAGKKGYELIVSFLKQAKIHLNKNGKILILFSSLSKPEIIKEKTKKLNYKFKLINKQKLFFEELFVYCFTQK
ncbi:DUF2431 domain-containing protein [Candidatus Pacearchaeota archaeon]|nr:DUF2431 domain-containing protein [Candidatus Pacearchaeota archaeon]MBD3283186.1 DUF2431 domain-containing protein [Candidatus Pacearchaeota archaeon]